MEIQNVDIGLKAANDIPAMVAYWDINGTCRFANSAYLKWFGKKESDVTDKSRIQDLMGSFYDDNYKYIKEAYNGKKQSFERKVRMADGEVRYSHATYTPDIVDGEVQGFTAHVVDITDRKRLEILVEKSEQRLRDVFESAPDALFIVDSTGKIKLINKQAEIVFGYSKSEIIGKDMGFLMPENQRNTNKNDFNAYLNSATNRTNGKEPEYFGQRKNGEKFRLEISLSKSNSDDDTTVIALVRDITERIRAEKALEESHKRNAIFVEQAPHAMAMLDSEMRYMAVSQKWIEDYGLKGRTIVGQSHYEIFPEIGDDWKAIHQECLGGEINKCAEAVFDRGDGRKQWLTWDVRPWYVSEGEIGGLIMYTADITEAKEREEEKRKVEEILDKSNEVARIGSWEVNLEEKTVFWSRITREIHEVDEDYVPNMETGINFFKKGESRDQIIHAVKNAIEHGTHYDIELELVTTSGKVKWVRSIGQPEYRDGICVRLYGVFHDIHEMKTAQIKLNQVHGELNAIFHSGPISIIGSDKDGLITHFNKGAEMMLQYSAEEMIGKKTPEIIHLPEEVKKRGEELSKQLGKTISGFDVFVEKTNYQPSESREWTYVRKDGSKISVLLVVTKLLSSKGEVVGYLGMATDITDRVEGERLLKEAKDNLEALSEELTDRNVQLANFAHITSHNLRSPVSNLDSLLALYKSAEGADEKKEIFDLFEPVVKHLSGTLQTLIETLKIRNKGKKDLEEVKFTDVFNKTKEIVIAQIMDSRAQISADFSEVNAINYDRSYLESIFLNLLTNAIKYKSPDKHPVIKVMTQTINERVVLTFEDNGLGMDLSRYGKKLFGLHNTFHNNSDSKGVGLYLTKNHIEAMGGSISVVSKVGKGSKFVIIF